MMEAALGVLYNNESLGETTDLLSERHSWFVCQQQSRRGFTRELLEAVEHPAADDVQFCAVFSLFDGVLAFSASHRNLLESFDLHGIDTGLQVLFVEGFEQEALE